jgi:hypothetical protein
MKKARHDPTTPALKRLVHDHRRIRKLLRRAGRAKSATVDVAADVERACAALAQHEELEDRWLYPALRGMHRTAGATVEAEVAHDLVRHLAAELRSMGPADERYLATVRVMRVLVEHHIEDEEDRLFPQAKDRSLDLTALAEAYEARRDADGAYAARPDADVTSVAHVVEDLAPARDAVRPPDDPAEIRQRARGPGRRGAH